MKHSVDVVVVGGGIIGLLTALELSSQQLRVVVVDQTDMAKAASWAGGGIMTPLYPWRYSNKINRLFKLSMQRYSAWFDKIQAETDIDPLLYPCGARFQLNPEVDIEQVISQWRETFGYVNDLNASYGKITQRKHQLDASQCANISNSKLLKALICLCKQNDFIRLMSHVEITPQDILKQQITLAGELFRFGKVVVAAGAWSHRLLPEVYQSLVFPVKGQMLQYEKSKQPERKNLEVTSMYISDQGYVIPRRDGRVLVGSTLEPGDWQPLPHQVAYQSLMSFAESVCPALISREIRAIWSGIRPGTSLKAPLICQHPEIDYCFFNTGHFRNGLCLAAGSAYLLRQLICEPLLHNRVTQYAELLPDCLVV